MPKALVEAAIARGQGRSVTGAQLESMTLEVLMPPNVALIADIETDNRNRTLHDLKYVVKKAGGVVGSTTFYFSRRGRIVLKSPKDRAPPKLADVLDLIIEQDGAEDAMEIPDGAILVWTQPAQLMTITEVLSKRTEFEVAESDIIWAANEDTTVVIDPQQDVDGLDALVAGMREFPEVKALFANVRRGGIDAETWEGIQRHIDG